jgi:hypothetical protein
MSSDSSAAGALIFTALYCLFVIAVISFQIFLFWRIFTKTGQSGAMSLIGLIPGVGLLILLCILAFAKWPIEYELDERRMMPVAPLMTGYAPPPPGTSTYPQDPSSPYPPYAPQ